MARSAARIDANRTESARKCRKWTTEEDALVKKWHTRLTCKEMAVMLGRTDSQVRNRCWLKRLDVMQKSASPRVWSDIELDQLRSSYAAGDTSMDINLGQLADRLGRNKANVCRKARELGLTNNRRLEIHPEMRKLRRPMFDDAGDRREHQSLTAKKRIAENGHPRGMLGKRHSDKTKETLRESSTSYWGGMTQEQKDDFILSIRKARVGRPNKSRGSWKAGWREVGGDSIFFRSRWEANYARYLEWLRSIGQIVSWEHEPYTFWFDGIKRGCVSYLPDFRVKNENGLVEWHEVKGWMDDRSKTVLKRMAKYHPGEKIVLVQEKQYKEIRDKVSRMIAGWEE